MTKCKLSPAALGLSLGIVWGLAVFITGLIAFYFSYGKPFVITVNAMYIGYEPSISGSIIGGFFGFVHGLITGAVIAFLYNCFACYCACCGPAKGGDESCGTMPKRATKKSVK